MIGNKIADEFVICGKYNTNSQIKFKSTILKSSLGDYSDAYVLVKGTISVGQGTDTAAIAADRNNKQVIFKNCALFTDCVNEINSTEVNIATDFDVVTLIYNLTEYSNDYSKKH